jgi:hypothetical protein
MDGAVLQYMRGQKNFAFDVIIRVNFYSDSSVGVSIISYGLLNKYIKLFI